ncbi:hypothetical protein G3N55_04160 [Dissulfurirhabdus thermomarina]|uniref:Uncharacterized protein n=1 Tax=Dissulfurirhabdus thermomarina TaxID=1765737 RepID=A0A6N9TL90_DISTH|nr:hypothetical protein [Dissulfurirhabdus thermomarina]NDY42042.1 hypothetical protein [Dissulfurirhabdus thermomarina]NMX22334.1 hypothetical protein [Dissulfurirhabdus thermomarina]
MKIVFDPDIPAQAHESLTEVIQESVPGKCACGCDEIYVSLQAPDRIDVKCYDCGTSFCELEVEVAQEVVEH